MTLRLYDARRRRLEAFAPIGPGPVGLYVCGITPYDTGHLGHAATYVTFDVLNRYLRHLGHRVTYVQNLTDVDDDMLRKARELGEGYLELGNRHVESFFAEMRALNWLPPDVYPRATQHIQPMQDLIARLIERGHAYVAERHVYYAVDTFPRYGELSRVPRDEMLALANERGNVPDMPGKRDPLDFVLWQPSAADEPAWPSPWGAGRPGWHIECSAMSMQYLGPRFEIHGGGGDLAFPHHESEIAQSEAATDEHPFVDFWMHAAMVHHQGEKMSKSLGNLVLVRDLLPHYPAEAIRHYLLSHHYRSEFAFDEAGVHASCRATTQLRRAAAVADDLSRTPRRDDDALDAPPVSRLRRRFLDAMDDDLDTPQALAVLESLATAALDESVPEATRLRAATSILELGGPILGLELEGGTPGVPAHDDGLCASLPGG